MRIELNYLVECQHETNAWTHFLCLSYIFEKHSILFNCVDSFGCIYTTEIKLDKIKKLTIKSIVSSAPGNGGGGGRPGNGGNGRNGGGGSGGSGGHAYYPGAGENKIIYSYNREEQKNAGNKD